MTKQMKSVSVALPKHTYELFFASMRVWNMKQAVLLRNVIGCGISDYYGAREHDFSRITKEMMEYKSIYRVGTSIPVEQYNTLQEMMLELGIESIPQLLRRLVDYIVLDGFAELNGLPVVKMQNEEIKVDVVIE